MHASPLCKAILSYLGTRISIPSIVFFYTLLVCASLFHTVIIDRATKSLEKDLLVLHNFGIGNSSAINDATNDSSRILALLFPGGLIGGYRNQVLRLIGFVHYAIENQMDAILLPSVLWSTTYKAADDEKRFFPIPMKLVFDIDHWNSFSPSLPKFTEFVVDGDCWEENLHPENSTKFVHADNSVFVSPLAADVISGSSFLLPVQNISRDILTGAKNLKARKLDLLPELQNCSKPFVYGGGRGAGRLWNDYIRLSREEKIPEESSSEHTKLGELRSLVMQALRPSDEWTRLAHECVKEQQTRYLNDSLGNATIKTLPYVALHARVEVDMMTHRCSRDMEKNLTKIFEMVESFKANYSAEKDEQGTLQGTFLAVSRHGMQRKTRDETVRRLAKENLEYISSKMAVDQTVFECGEKMMQKWYSKQDDMEDDFYGSLLPSILNFYIATESSVFIGVSKSSWSTDVWTTRYYQGKGRDNYEYTSTGISRVPNGGLPQPHGNC